MSGGVYVWENKKGVGLEKNIASIEFSSAQLKLIPSWTVKFPRLFVPRKIIPANASFYGRK